MQFESEDHDKRSSTTSSSKRTWRDNFFPTTINYFWHIQVWWRVCHFNYSQNRSLSTNCETKSFSSKTLVKETREYWTHHPLLVIVGMFCCIMRDGYFVPTMYSVSGNCFFVIVVIYLKDIHPPSHNIIQNLNFFCGTDNILYNIPLIQSECEEYYVEYR